MKPAWQVQEVNKYPILVLIVTLERNNYRKLSYYLSIWSQSELVNWILTPVHSRSTVLLYHFHIVPMGLWPGCGSHTNHCNWASLSQSAYPGNVKTPPYKTFSRCFFRTTDHYVMEFSALPLTTDCYVKTSGWLCYMCCYVVFDYDHVLCCLDCSYPYSYVSWNLCDCWILFQMHLLPDR